jgi:hypothetical protein
MKVALSLLIMVLSAASVCPRAAAQARSPRYPLPADVESIDGIVRAFCEVVSTAAGVLPEREIHRITQQFGNVAHVWSTYVASDTPGGAPTVRGISSIHLYFDGRRWWITGWMDEGEQPWRPIPREFLPRDHE